MVASTRHFGYSRSSGLAPSRARVYFDDSIVSSVHTRNMYFCDILRRSFINLTPFKSIGLDRLGNSEKFDS